MNEDPKEIHNATPERLSEELDKYFERVKQQAPEKISYAAMITGHENEDGDVHVRSIMGGPPHMLAEGVMEMVDELIRREPAFAAYFLAHFMNKLMFRNIKSPPDLNTVETEVNEFIERLKKDSPPTGSTH